MCDTQIKRVLIVGGGTAGWMTAAAMTRLPAGVEVQLIESEDIGTVGVGEASIPPLTSFNAMLGIAEAEFLQACQGTFKLGIEFVDWGELGDRYIHPFGDIGLSMDGVSFHQYWLRRRQAGDGTPIDDYCLANVAARLNRFTPASSDPRTVLSSLRHAYHFDAGLYARFLRRFSEQRGVQRLEGMVVRVELDAAGAIAAVHLKDGRRLQADLFIDCTGFRGLIIEGSLKAGYEDWSQWLPCDRAFAVPSESVSPLVPFTRSTADAAGWRWRIPLQHRIGNGYVYASRFSTDEAARKALLAGLDGKPIAEPRQLQFLPGRRKRHWIKNCVAIGLSSGFLEPLESTSIHLIQSSISRLMGLFPDRRFDPVLADSFNRVSQMELEQIRDFIILHYKATRRRDTPFWRYVGSMDVPETLAHRMALFQSGGRFTRIGDELFSEASWVAVLTGQGLVPPTHDPLADAMPDAVLAQRMEGLRRIIRSTAEAMPTHEAFIQRYCPAAPADV